MKDRRAPMADRPPTVDVMTPTGHHVIVQVEDVPDETEGGLFLPEDARQRQADATQFGRILAVGFQAWAGFGDGQPWAEVGDNVLFRKHAGSVIRYPDQRVMVRVINDDDILIKITEQAVPEGQTILFPETNANTPDEAPFDTIIH